MFESIAYAAPAAAGPQANPVFGLFPFVLLIVIFYFLLIRPQQKKQKELQAMLGALKKGDRIVTVGGIVGRIMTMQDDYVVIKTGDGDFKMEVLKSAISGLRDKK